MGWPDLRSCGGHEDAYTLGRALKPVWEVQCVSTQSWDQGPGQGRNTGKASWRK